MKELHTQSIASLVQGLKDKHISAVEILNSYLDRIKRYDKKLNIFVNLNDQAIKEAEKADKEIASNGYHKPLLGIPLAIKDNFLTAGIKTTASSKLLKDYYPQYESTVTARLKKAGAIIIGKTNMDAWAHGSSTETSDFGPTLNPWDTDRLPGGSSGGSAAAVAAQMVPAAIGSETAGSVRQPAAWCGVVGFKPTYGRVSRYGVIAMASSTDSPGPLTRDVSDAALITQIIAGHDPYDATTSPLPVPSYFDKLNMTDLKGIRIGLVQEYLIDEMDEKAKKLVRDAAFTLESLGARVEEVSLLHPKYSIGVYTVLQRSEVSSNLARFDGIRFGQDRSHFSQEAKRRIMLGTYTLSAGYYDAYYKKALAVRTKIVDQFNEVYKNYDLVLGAVSPGPALKVGATANEPMFGEMQDILVEPSSIAGLTSISVNCGFLDNLPFAIQLTAAQFKEDLVLRTAKVFQDATNYQKFPNLNHVK